MDIAKVDKNFAIKKTVDKEDVRFYSAEDAPFQIYGLLRENGKYRRMPEAIALGVSKGVHRLHTSTAGGRVRFVTDSNYIAIRATFSRVFPFAHFAMTGSTGFDLYADGAFVKTFTPPVDLTEGYESVIDLRGNQMREITVNFPLFSGVTDLYIGLQEGARIEAPKPYANRKPVVYYGSSITQGACASRPGRAYQAVLSRALNYDFVNLGFAGSAKGEDAMTDYIKGLAMSLFVYDYDYNAPDVAHLEATHEKMFLGIREANPDLPILILSRPRFNLSGEEKKRLDVIRTTYENALARGDNAVWLIDGPSLTALCEDEGTVDNCHPTDFGFASMANAILPVMREIPLKQ